MRPFRLVSSLLAFAFLLLPGTALAERLPQTVLDHMRAAIGTRAIASFEHGLVARGTAEIYQVEGDYALYFHADGRYADVLDSPLGITRIFDGTDLWIRDWSRTVSRTDMEDREEGLTLLWLATGQWLISDLLEVVGIEETDDGKPILSLRLGYYEGTLTVDPQTWLPERFVHTAEEGINTYVLSEWFQTNGITLPGSVTLTRFQGEVELWHLTELVPATPDEPLAGLRVSREYDDVRFDNRLPAELDLQKTASGHLIAKASVNGGEPGWFVIDTGAGASCISSRADVCDSLESVGRVVVGGVGGHTEASFRQAASLTVGRATLDRPVFVELDLGFLSSAWGVEIVGILGFDLLSRTVAEFDLVDGKVALYDPASYALDSGWQPLRFHSRHPCMEATLEEEDTAWYKLDTGAAGTSVTFHAPYVTEQGLLEGRDTDSGQSGGVGGYVSTRTGTVRSFTLGSETFRDLDVEFAVELKGAFADAYTAGNIGGELLERFRMVIDYGHERIALLPRSGS